MDTSFPSQPRNVVVDIETLDTAPTAIILSIGAYCLETGDRFYEEISINSQKDRTFSESTLKWWLQQPIDLIPLKGIGMLSDALWSFNRYFTQILDTTPENRYIWSNGTDFDISILAHAYDSHGIPIPWKYNSVRDYRTLRQLFPEITHTFIGAKHSALHDALNEGEHLAAILQYIRELRSGVVA